MSMGQNYHYYQNYINKDHECKDEEYNYDQQNKQNQKSNMKKDEKKKSINQSKMNNKSPDRYQYKVLNFDYSLLKPLLSEKKENIVLLVTGSFNPIHRMHIEILNIAYRHLLSLKKYNIVCGFISPSADCYVKKKQPPLIPFDLRCYMIETAIREYENENKNNNNLKIFLHRWEGTHDYFIDFPDVIQAIQNQLSYYFKDIDIQLVYVCGMDLYDHCNDYFNKNVIVVERKPYKNNKYKDNPDNLIYIVKDEKSRPFSSTSIRDCYIRRDYIGIKNITFPEVADMVIRFFENIK